jgi:hypothetical protein
MCSLCVVTSWPAGKKPAVCPPPSPPTHGLTLYSLPLLVLESQFSENYVNILAYNFWDALSHLLKIAAQITYFKSNNII